MSELVLQVLFWTAAATVAYAYAGFPVLLALRATLWPAPRPRTGGPLPRVSLVLVVYNERAVIDARLANVEAMDYPRDRLQVLVASDGSDDGTDERVAAHRGPTPIRLLSLPRLGKNAALNRAVELATGEILVFSDADSLFEPDALRRLVAPFADPTVGGVGGDYRYGREIAEGEGERTYWSIDRLWKELESRGGQMTSATGQIYAIRRELFQPVPDGMTDDFTVSTGVIEAGRRLWFASDAVARGPVADSADAEFRRKVRVIGRGLAGVWQRRRLLDPRVSGFYALQLFSHKVLRRLVGVPLVVLAVTAPCLWSVHPVYALASVGQAVFHGLAAVGWWGRHGALGRPRIVALPMFFDLVNAAGLVAVSDLVRGRRHLGWVPHRPAAAAEGPPRPAASAEGR